MASAPSKKKQRTDGSEEVKRDNQIFRWCATQKMSDSKFTSPDVQTWLEAKCDKWAFQEEKGATGYLHWQIAFKLKERLRLNQLRQMAAGGPLDKAHFSPMHSEEGSDEYVMKEDTRVKGPWSSDREEPREIKGIQLRAWQQTIAEDCKEPCTTENRRKIQIVIDRAGGAGKSTLRTYLRFHGIANIVPWCSKSTEDVMAMIMNMPTRNAYLFDIPRDADEKTTRGVWAACECLKDGWVYDKRHKYREKIFSAPKIWVFMNRQPDWDLLTSDRWGAYLMFDQRLVQFTATRYATLKAQLKKKAKAQPKKPALLARDPLDDLATTADAAVEAKGAGV